MPSVPTRTTASLRLASTSSQETAGRITSVGTGRGALLEYDLGEPREIRAAMLQGDGNDQYDLATSADGKRYPHLWRAGPAGSGLQTRSTDQLNGHARFIRITASRGDLAPRLCSGKASKRQGWKLARPWIQRTLSRRSPAAGW